MTQTISCLTIWFIKLPLYEVWDLKPNLKSPESKNNYFKVFNSQKLTICAKNVYMYVHISGYKTQIH